MMKLKDRKTVKKNSIFDFDGEISLAEGVFPNRVHLFQFN